MHQYTHTRRREGASALGSEDEDFFTSLLTHGSKYGMIAVAWT